MQLDGLLGAEARRLYGLISHKNCAPKLQLSLEQRASRRHVAGLETLNEFRGGWYAEALLIRKFNFDLLKPKNPQLIPHSS